jgi:hypothetical protein
VETLALTRIRPLHVAQAAAPDGWWREGVDEGDDDELG